MTKSELTLALEAAHIAIAERDDHIARLKILVVKNINGAKRSSYTRERTPEQIAAATKWQTAQDYAKANGGTVQDALAKI